jgi:hypothetical protein
MVLWQGNRETLKVVIEFAHPELVLRVVTQGIRRLRCTSVAAKPSATVRKTKGSLNINKLVNSQEFLSTRSISFALANE